MIRLGAPDNDSPAQVGQDRDKVALAHIHQLLDLEGLERSEQQAVPLSIEQLAHRTIDGVVMQGVLDLAHLYAGDKVGE